MSSFSDIRSGLLKKYNVRSSDEEDRKETKSTTTVSAPDTTSDFYSIRENLLGKYSQENVTQRRQAVSDWTSRYNKVMENLSSGFGDSGQWKTGQDMDSMEVEIGSLLRDYEDIREYADRTGLPNAFRYANELKKLQEDMPQYRDYFGQWDSQEDYDTFLDEQREIQAKRNLNLSDYQTQIDRKMQTLQRFQNQQGKSGGNQEKIQALEDEIQDMVVYQRQAEFLQRRDRLEAVTESPDFAQGSQYTQDGDDRILYDYINNPDGYRDQYNQDRERLNLLARNPDLQYGGFADVAGLEDGSEDPFQLKGYDLLTDEEIAVYNYYYSTQGSEAARNYLETIQEDLNYRVAINRFQQGYQGNTANSLLYGIEAGVNQAQTGLVNALDAVTGKSDYIPLSSKQILSSLVRDDLAESGWRMPDALGGASLGQAAYDLITTSANMAPSILTSLAVNYIAPGWGSAVGAAMMAGSAAGNAYQEALNAGYGKDRARTYAQLIGTSEGALQYVLGGINALGGKVSGNAIAKALSKVENGLLRAAGQIGGNMLSEGTEEAIQEVLEPIFRNIVLGTDEDVDWEQVAYSGVLGAVTGGIFEGAGMLLNQNANTRSRAGRDSQIPGQSALGSDTSTPGPTSDGVNVEQDTVNPQQADVPTFQETVSPEQEIQMAPEEVETEAPEPVSVPESNVEVEEAVQSSKTISEVAQQYGNQAGAVEQIYRLGSEDQSIDTFEREFGLAYDMGKSGVSESYAMQSQGIQSLTEQQRQFAFQTGQAAAQALAKTQASQNQSAANGKTGWRKGVVKGEGVSIADLTQTFNDPQRTAYKTLSTIAEATGIDIVLYKSQTDANGNFQGAQGKFKWSENAIYIDVNAGLSNVKDVGELSKYTMLRTFNHEFTHFIEKWNPEQYNEFRSTVFNTLTEQGENVEDLIDMKLAQDSGGTMTYDMAAREVVAEAMTDILPDSNFVERLASQNRTLFETLLSKIKEFLANVKSYFSKLAGNTSREARAMKKQMGDTVSYLENIVKMFDDVAVKAVETYQATVAEDTQVEKKVETAEAKSKQETKQAEKPKAPAKNKTREAQKTNTSVSPENQKMTSTADTPGTVVKSLDLNYQKISPSLSVFTDSGNGAYLLYDDNTITPSEVIFHQFNSMDGWTAQGVFYLFRPVMDGKSVDTYKQSELDGFYRIDRVVKRAKLRKVGSTFILDNAGIIEIADYKKPVRSDNSTTLKVEKSAVQQEISSQDLKSSEGPKIQDKERKPTEAPAAKTEAAGKAAAENPYERLRESLQRQSSFHGEGFGFFIQYTPGAKTYQGQIRRDSGNWYVENARDVLYTSLEFKTRAEAISDLVEVAANNRFLEETKKLPTEVQRTPSESVAENLLSSYLRKGQKITASDLYKICDQAFGGTQAQGVYNRKDAYDAMELAVNRYVMETMSRYNGNTAADAKAGLQRMMDVLSLLPTQSVRTEEQQQFQQFSTPPNIAYLASWSAKVVPSDVVLEPSAGIGGLAAFPKAWGAQVVVNELSQRRLGILRSMGFDQVFNENAEQIDNVLPDSIRPSLVIMNPPFSSTAGRTASNKTSNAERHINQALERLVDGGRLVAILGKGMNNTAYARYWNQLRKDYSIRANLSIDGDNYKKYGTTWGVQLVVIDKTGPQTGETVTGEFQNLMDVPDVLEGIRNDRTAMEGYGAAGSDNRVRESVSDGTVGQSAAGHQGSSQRAAGSTAESESGKNLNGTAPVSNGNGNPGEGRVSKTGGKEGKGKQRGSTGTDGRTDSGSGDGISEPVGTAGPESQLPRSDVTDQADSVSDDGVYSTFVSPEIPLKGGKKHPAVLVESAAMAAVSMPKATYRPHLPENVVKNNLSDAQLVTVTYAGQAHEQKLPDGSRRGFFIGDGTGVGKGRQIAGIILDNFMQGRKKAVWVSKNNDLFQDAIRDWTATTGRSKEEVVSQSKIKAKDKIELQEGILFSTYDTLKSQKGGNRLDQIVDWVGKDFDGVIAFDEAHNMGNLFGKKGKFGKSSGSEKAKAGVDLQRRLPKARIVYVSATGATEVDNLAYAERLGLWGQGTAFQDSKDFISKIGSSGLAAMELVVRDLKAMGVYVARSISYNGVNYDTVEHTLNPMQTEIYNTMSKAWQKTMQNVQAALESTGGKNNSTARQRAMGNYYSSMQRFYNQVLTSMSMPSVIADMRKELAAGHSCVLQVVNTNEAQQNKQLAAVKAEGGSLDDLDLTPRESLIGYLRTSFPVQMFEEYTDEEGNLRSRPVVDSKGEPVLDRKAVRQRDALIAEINEMSIPDGPLEMLFDAFGPENVAENTGRSRRVVPKKMPDGSIKRVEESRTLNHRTADVQAFQDGKKRILVFSDAGGTGKSYHADRSEKNQQQRIHYVLQPGWVASNAVQGFGRTHRSNEASAPVYKLITTNIKGQKRFTSTIARRLDQLGALTKGQRDTGSGMFGAKDNLETDLARDSLREFYIRLGKNQIEGMNGLQILDRLGLKQKFTDEFGRFKINDAIARDIGTFLNRILALEVDEQNVVFDGFLNIYETALEAAIQAGTLDTGMENVKADKIEILDDDIIRTDRNSGASTYYVQAKTYRKPRIATTVEEMAQRRTGFVGLYQTDTGAIKAVYRIADKTTEWGAVRKQYRLAGPNLGVSTNVWGEDTLKNRATEIPKEKWQEEWEKEIAKVPEYNEETLHMLTGALLPIWNTLPQEGSTKVKRLISSDGSVYLGRVIDSDAIDAVLRKFDVSRTKEAFTSRQVMDKALKEGTRFQLTNDRAEIFRSRVSNEWRLEIKQQNSWYLRRTYPDIIQERIAYVDRYFIPTGEKGLAILDKLLDNNPVRGTSSENEQLQKREYLNEGDHYGEDNEGRRAGSRKTDSPGLARGEDSGFGGQSLGSVSAGNQWEGIGAEQRSQIINQLDLYTYDNPESEFYLRLFEDGDLSDLDVHMNAISNMAQQFYEAMQGNRILLENDPRFRWLGDSLSLFVQDVENILSGNFTPVTDEEFQARTHTFSDREILEIAADNLRLDELTEGERDALRIFRDRLSRLHDLQEQRADLGTLYREQQFGANGAKVDRAEAEKTRNRMQVLDSQIEKARNGVLDVENKAVLRRVLQSARKVVEQKQKDADTVTLRRWRDRRNNAEAIKKYRNRIAKDVKSMTDWVINPSNKDILRHIPDALKNSVIPFLTSIDFTSKRQLRGGEATQADQAFLKRLDILRSTLKNRLSDDYTGMYSGYTDLPPQFMERLDGFVNSVKEIARENSGEFIINRMTASELKDLSDVVRGLKKLIQDCNRFHANAMFQHVYEAGDSTISGLGQIGKAPSRTKTGESFHNFVFWEQIRPTYAFERFGKGGKAIYDGLRRGQSQLAFDTKEILAFSEKVYTEAEVKQWEKETLEIGLEDGTVRMKVSQAMSFYELSKRKQALGHILGQGVRVATYYHGKEKISDTGHRLTMDDVSSIIDRLTPRQKEVADQLQKFMQEKGGQWGNYVSVKRFGENLFGEPNYFPINSDGRHLEATADENPSAASLYALLNMGFTKQTREKANNRLILYSIFDVFANHMASMAQYHSMALPVLDALKWFNYRQETPTGEIVGVRDELNRVFGAPEESRPGSGKRGYAENFVIGILKAFNGTEAQGVPSDARGLNALRRFNMAQVAYNFRVVIQQPLAITRAAMILDYGSIVKGLKLKPSQIQENIRQMQSYSGIAAWKSLGFYDTNISRGLTSLIKHSDTAFEKIGEVGMLGAEKADEITWAAMWSACKEEIRKKQPKLTPDSEAFFQAVTELFEEVVYKTQVVDSILTKNAYLRSKGLFARFTGSFMSEPTTTASMLVDAFDKYRMDLQKGDTPTKAWEKNRKNIVRTVYVYAVGALILAGVQAVADGLRDDDDYATFLEKWLDAFQGNLIDELMPFNKLPIMSDFYEVAKELSRILGMDTYGNPPQSVYMQWYDSLVNGAEILYQKITGEETNYTWYAGAYKLLQAASGIVGLPMAAATREIVTAWNSTIGAMSPRLKVKTYDAGDMANIKYAFQDGYLTEEEAMDELLSKGVVDNEDEAYWKIQEWSAEGEYSRYDRLFDAIRNGQSTQEAMEELTSHGYEEKDVRSRVKSQIGQWYQNGEITKQQAIDMMEKHLDMDSEDILSQVNRWSSKVVTGIAFEDIKEEFLAGNITASRAIDMYVLYGGYTKEDARATVQYWDFKNRYPDVYADDAWFDAYYEKIQSSGIPIKTYMEYRNQVREITGEGKKERRMAVIDSLPITNAQKDALYYGEGWAESTIDEAPWH